MEVENSSMQDGMMIYYKILSEKMYYVDIDGQRGILIEYHNPTQELADKLKPAFGLKSSLLTQKRIKFFKDRLYTFIPCEEIPHIENRKERIERVVMFRHLLQCKQDDSTILCCGNDTISYGEYLTLKNPRPLSRKYRDIDRKRIYRNVDPIHFRSEIERIILSHSPRDIIISYILFTRLEDWSF